MDLTPHDKLDLAEHEAQTKMQEQMSHYYLKLAAAGLVGQDGHLVTLPDGQPDWSRIQEQRIRLNPKLFGISDKDPDFHFYETGELLPHEFKLKMQEMYGGITPNQLEYKKYGASKDDNKPSWAKMKLKHSKEGDMIRSGVDIDEGPNGYTRRFGGSSDFSEKPAVMIVGGKRLVRKVRRVPKKKSPLSPDNAATTQVPQHDQQSPRRSPTALPGAKAKKLSASQANGWSISSSPRRNPASPRRRVSPPPTQKPSWKATNGSPKRPQNSQSIDHASTNGTRSSYPTNANAVGQHKPNLNRQGNKQPIQAMSPPRSKLVPARTPPPGKMRQISDESEAQTPVTTNNKHVHSERLMNGSLLNEPPSIRVASYQPVAQGTHFLDARAGLKKTPPKAVPSNPPPWRPTQAPTSHSYQQAQPVTVTRVPAQDEPRVTHKLMFLADEDESEPALVTPAADERYDEEEYEEVEEYYDHNEKVNGENLYYEEEEEVLSIHEVFVDEETVEDGSSYYEEEVIDDSGEIEYYEEEEEEAISELEAKLAAKQAQLARFR
jgi:hypothetical protein